jgi:hypothetical protein
MGVYLGNVGNIELTRLSLEGGKESVVNPSDVNPDRDRFSFDFDPSYLISGDRVELKTTDDTDLDFVDASGWANNTVQSSGAWYVFIDELGGIRLYDNFDDSLEGSSDGLVPLTAIIRNIPIVATVVSTTPRMLGCVNDYEINTNRESVDVTTLSDEYRQQYSGLISGSGRLTAEWDYVRTDGYEPVNYLMQLVLRTEVGSSFRGKFYIKSPNTRAAAGSFESTQINDELWWEFDALITSSATSFASGSIITSVIDFITTGPVRLRAKTKTTQYLLQESGDKIKLEQSDTSYLLLEQSD